jgi:hypothetical protein
MHHRADCLTVWFPAPDPLSYTALFPRLSSVVEFHKVRLGRRPLIRAALDRLRHALSHFLIYPAVILYLCRLFEILFTVTTERARTIFRGFGSAWPFRRKDERRWGERENTLHKPSSMGRFCCRCRWIFYGGDK